MQNDKKYLLLFDIFDAQCRRLFDLSTLLILASSSPRRQELIRQLGLPVEVIASSADEQVEPDLSPAEIVETLSLRKAMSVCRNLQHGRPTQGIVIGSDTIVVKNGKVIGKPRDEQEALSFLQELQGDTHQVFSGVACIDTFTGRQAVSHSVTRVKMKALSKQQMERYVQSGEPLDKAGAYGIQGLGATIVERIEGDYFTVVGLPLALLSDMLSEFGVTVL